MADGEFDIIDHYFRPLSHGREDVSLGIGDDAAIVMPPAGQALVMAVDGMVEGVHFPVDTDPADLAWKLLAVNLSDLAAMGARSRWATLYLSLPEHNESFLRRFASGLRDALQAYDVALVGGDTVHGPLSASLQLSGTLPNGQGLRRSGAQVGDHVFVSGTLGDAGAGLALIQERMQASPPEREQLLQRLNRPIPQTELGPQLLDIASSCIDLSDGLVSDLGHILKQSGVGATIEIDKLPLSKALQTVTSDQQARRWALCAGDDYELCFTVPPQRLAQLEAVHAEQPITDIGRITDTPGLALRNGDGSPFEGELAGYDHFKSGERDE